MFKRLLLKLTTECTYTFNHKCFKEIDGCTMVSRLPVTFRDIYKIKMRSEIVSPQKPLFYHRYIDGIYSTRNKLKHDELFEKLDNYYPKINLTIEKLVRKHFGHKFTSYQWNLRL